MLKYLFIFFVAWGFLHSAFILIDGYGDNIQQADAILIFGNKVNEDGIPSNRLQSRLERGLELYNDGIAPIIIVSGGFGKEGYEEAVVMKEYLVGMGVPADAIIEDKDGYNTYQTAQNLVQIAEDNDISSVAIVSQYYHITRARLALERFGFEEIYSAHARILPGLRDLWSIPREFAGFYYYFFRSYGR
jgi:uncharacterized SAM-binding protein YcdF (DUF218 family)